MENLMIHSVYYYGNSQFLSIAYQVNISSALNNDTMIHVTCIFIMEDTSPQIWNVQFEIRKAFSP